MYHDLPLSLIVLLSCATLPSAALPRLSERFDPRRTFSSLFPPSPEPQQLHVERRDGNFDTNSNGSSFLWVIQDTYAGQNFFDRWTFYDQGDPTHGTVNFVTSDVAFANGLAYVTSDNKVIMKGDNTTQLAAGVNRDSVRISSMAQYNTGLFILDTNHAPWGCGVWPAFWTVGSGQWPFTGEIDIIEGVHDNEHNQVTWHTAPGCYLNPNASFTGTPVQNNGQNVTTCDGTLPGNAGCGITEWSRASYGPYFDSQGGGVFAMKWDENGIAIWSFYRAAIPQDITQGEPNPSNWGVPVASLDPAYCNPIEFFVNHSIIFDITFCGDWAGNSYATSGCPGTCSDRLMDPANFVNASWSINSLKVYRKQNFAGSISSTAVSTHLSRSHIVAWMVCAFTLTTTGMFLVF